MTIQREAGIADTTEARLAPDPVERGPVTGRFTEAGSADVVASSFDHTPDPRLREVMSALVRHLHAFVKEVELTEQEWDAGIAFLTATGQKCDVVRQEFVLLSDVLGVSMLVETIAHRAAGQVTESTVLGPFHMVDSPPRALGAQIDSTEEGESCLVTGRVLRADGSPVAGATVDVWQADAEGYYDVQRPDEVPELNLRGLFTTALDGSFWFRTIVPRFYPIPTDGPVGDLLSATARHPNRPAHIHFLVKAPGCETLTTHVFVAGSPYLESDAVFGVKDSLVFDFPTVDDPAQAEALGFDNPFRRIDFPIVLKDAAEAAS